MRQYNLFNMSQNENNNNKACKKEVIGTKIFEVLYMYENKKYSNIIYASNSETTCNDIKTYIQKEYRHSKILSVTEKEEV